jgi:hypothetical protein
VVGDQDDASRHHGHYRHPQAAEVAPIHHGYLQCKGSKLGSHRHLLSYITMGRRSDVEVGAPSNASPGRKTREKKTKDVSVCDW